MKNAVIVIVLLAMLGVVATGCSPPVEVAAEESRASCPPGQAFSSIDRSCHFRFNTQAPWGTIRSLSLVEDTPGTVILDYENTPEDDLAIACEVDQVTRSNLAEVAECACSAGICTAELVGFPNVISGSILYRFQDSTGVWGDYQSARVQLKPVNDHPTFCPVSLAREAGNNCENIFTGKDYDCIAPGDPYNFSLGRTPDFEFFLYY